MSNAVIYFVYFVLSCLPANDRFNYKASYRVAASRTGPLVAGFTGRENYFPYL